MWITVRGKEVVDYTGFDQEMVEKAWSGKASKDRKALEEAKETSHGPVREVLREERGRG